jgi:hypothetical protein
MFLTGCLIFLAIFFLFTALVAFSEGNKQEGARQAGKALLAVFGALLCFASTILDTLYDE